MSRILSTIGGAALFVAFWYVLFFVVFAISPAYAQSAQCADREAVIAHLTGKYGETRRAVGLAGQGAVMEMHAADVTGTWTITMTLPNGMTCMVASGQEYQSLTEELPPAGTVN